MGWTPEQQRSFIANDLGPALEENGFGDRIFLPYWADKVLSNSTAAKYVSGIAIHWYEDPFILVLALDNKRDTVALGDWSRAERYAKDILQDLQHWVTGWTDWNMTRDMQGGPNWVSNFVDIRVAVEAVSGDEKDISCVTFLREKQTLANVCAIFGDANIDVSFKVNDVEWYLLYSLLTHSLATFRCNDVS
ncbi:hypothetical protein CHS0354_040918 [Potamilus streckersoni]|uniref:Glucosylceramidase n=1 Tax=Potamilus streckersoni TaxID=2493646 RepID=A0AAE0SLB1_9BIVA|nr:hypothetical protein CHS0354_040918 [Potamilus streckersoni]